MDLRDFYRVVNKIKFIKRQGWVDRGLDADTIGAHNSTAQAIGWMLAELEGVDKSKVVMMLNLHDWVMAEMEDVTLHSGKYEKKRDMEEEAKLRISGVLSKGLGQEYLKLFGEFNMRKTPEARVAREADKLETLLQGEIYEEQTGRNDILDNFLEVYESIFETKTGKEVYKGIKSRHEVRKK